MNINTQDYWNRIWNSEGALTWRVYPNCYQKIVSIIGKNKKVLDVGCGVGVLASQIKANNNNVFGTDISDTAVKIMNDVYNVDGEAMDFISDKFYTFFGKNKFDFVVATEFLEHFEDPRFVIERMCSIAKNIIIAVPNNCLGNEEVKEHHQKFTLGDLYNLCKPYLKEVNIVEFDDSFNAKGQNYLLPTLMIWGNVK